MDVYEAVRSRRAVRGFTDEPVPQAVLERVLAAAAWAPSGSNLQPWHIYVVTGAPLAQMKKLGGMKGILGMLPGVGKIKDQLDAAGIDDRVITRQEAIIKSMTRAERGDPDLINGSRRKRIAAGSGVEVSEVNKLLKMHRQMADMMKKVGKGGRMPQMPGGLGGMFGGGMPPGFPRK